MSHQNQGRGRQSYRGQSQGRGYGRGRSCDQNQGQNQPQNPNPSWNRGRNQSQSQSQNRGQRIDQSQGRGSRSSQHREVNRPVENPPEPPEEITKTEDKILNSVKIQADDWNITPRRPRYGTGRNEITLWANYFELDVDTRGKLFQYDIVFPDQERKPTGKKLARVVKLLLDSKKFEPYSVVTDFATTLISHTNLPEESFTVSYCDEHNVRESKSTMNYIVQIKYTDILLIDHLLEHLKDPNKPCERENIVKALNIFLNHYPQGSKGHATIGSSRSFPLDDTSRICKGLQFGCAAVKGYYSSIRPATSRILVNINVTYGIFHQKNGLAHIMSNFIKKWGDSPAALQKLAASLKGVRIEHNYLKDKTGNHIRRVRTIFDLASKEDGSPEKDERDKKQPRVPSYGAKAKEVEFWFNDGYITVSKFFQKENKVTTNSDLPLINVGSRTHPTYLLPDVCEVLAWERAKVVRYDKDMVSRIPIHGPSENANDIENNGLRAIGMSNGDARNSKRLENFGISVSKPKLITVKGRRLSEPEIQYNYGRAIKSSNWNLENIQLASKPVEKRWTCVIIQPRKDDTARLNDSLQELHDMLKKNGVSIGKPHPSNVETILYHEAKALESELRNVFGRVAEKVDFLLVVLPTKESFTYNYVKRLGDIEYGIPTLCIFRDTLIPKPRPSYFSPKPSGSSSGNSSRNAPIDTPKRISGNLVGNLALKLNLKFKNNNQTVNLGKLDSKLNLGETMIVGIDVTHSPVPGQPSIAGMVASIDKNLGQWPAVLRHQEKPRIEMVTHLREMLETRLNLWCSRHRSYPKNIIVYRDGVSEGQYKLVVNEELPKLKDACKKLYSQVDMPRITIVVVGKRHHTRFYAGKNRDNPSPGTVVDRGITEALNWDFFLQSHKAIRGTARPAHYFVVHDEIFGDKFKEGNAANALEIFTHSLCYIFGRSTGPVSICTPAYYADIACNRARCYVAAGTTSSAASQAQVAGSASDGQRPLGSEGLLLHPRMKDSMFYI
ncbi:Piwi-domain-containing protein [Daldinia decipiens]|uniref:Piwi-domain-containing protein n=1 Tax=Daldinia decipiens TaxID=326647 RepID=UPI0020C441F6|nr:Piwi-domain-containing protein [Daldinia decipiens]KAI1655200.1 Piwi-domain-containing protein [Daldinia decipiens]